MSKPGSVFPKRWVLTEISCVGLMEQAWWRELWWREVWKSLLWFVSNIFTCKPQSTLHVCHCKLMWFICIIVQSLNMKSKHLTRGHCINKSEMKIKVKSFLCTLHWYNATNIFVVQNREGFREAPGTHGVWIATEYRRFYHSVMCRCFFFCVALPR